MATQLKEKVNLNYIFEPASIAVIGASNRVGGVGHSVIYNLKNSGFTGKLYPVNPKDTQIIGIDAFKSVNDIPASVDMAVLIVAPQLCAPILEECGKKGVKAAIIISAGFKEVGAEGKALEDAVVAVVHKYNIALIGPNCLGIINTEPQFSVNASFAQTMPSVGNIAFLSQSGALCTAVLDYAKGMNIGFSKFISIGNKADTSEVDLLKYLGDDDQKVILMYIEDLVNGHEFIKVAYDITSKKKKPIIAIKSGRTAQGAAAASSHTGSLAGSDQVYEAIFKQADVIRVNTVEELFNIGIVFSQQPIPKTNRTAIVTNAGGPGIMATDACVENGLDLVKLEEKTINRLKEVLPPTANFYNPIDVIGDARDDRYFAAMEAVLNDHNVDNMIVILTPQSMTNIDDIARAIVKVRRPDKVIIPVFMGMADVASGIKILRDNKISSFLFPVHAAKAIHAMLKYKAWIERPTTGVKHFKADTAFARELIQKSLSSQRAQMPMEDVFSIFKAYGLSVPHFWIITDKKEIAGLPITYPAVLKVMSEDIIHKIDMGGVKLKIQNREEMEKSFEDMQKSIKKNVPHAKIDGYFVQEMAQPGREAILGVNRDPKFGPLLMFGMGGSYVEFFKDVSFRLAPVSEASAKKMIEETKFHTILKGVRGQKEADFDMLRETICRLSQLVVDNPEIIELDINPLFVYNKGDGGAVIDGRITLKI